MGDGPSENDIDVRVEPTRIPRFARTNFKALIGIDFSAVFRRHRPLTLSSDANMAPLLLQNATVPQTKSTNLLIRGTAITPSFGEEARVRLKTVVSEAGGAIESVQNWSEPSQSPMFSFGKSLYFALLAVILCCGAIVRFYPTASFRQPGFDEVFYTKYVSVLDKNSLFDYPFLCRQ